MIWNNAMGMSDLELSDIFLCVKCFGIPKKPLWKGGQIDILNALNEYERRKT